MQQYAQPLAYAANRGVGARLRIHDQVIRRSGRILCQAIAEGSGIDAKVQRGEVLGVVMVGGATRMPAVRRAVAEFFGEQGGVRVLTDVILSEQRRRFDA